VCRERGNQTIFATEENLEMRNYTLPLLLVLLLTFSGTVFASTPDHTELDFELHGETLNSPEPTYHGNVARIRGLEAGGDVSGDLTGKFHYVENATVNFITWQSNQQGFMTMEITEGCRNGPGTIEIRFQGLSQVDPETWIGVIEDQPFTILYGTGGCAGIQGNGTRSAVVVPTYPFIVTYEATVHWTP
jgi:hypothetical protein